MKPTAPVLVALLRGLLEAVVLGAIGAVYVFVTDQDFGSLNVLVPAALAGLRTLEGIADQRIDPTKQRGRLGGSNAP